MARGIEHRQHLRIPLIHFPNLEISYVVLDALTLEVLLYCFLQKLSKCFKNLFCQRQPAK